MNYYTSGFHIGVLLRGTIDHPKHIAPQGGGGGGLWDMLPRKCLGPLRLHVLLVASGASEGL